MTKIVLAPLQLRNAAGEFDQAAASYERLASEITSAAATAGLAPAAQATIAASLRGAAARLRAISAEERDIAHDLRRRAGINGLEEIFGTAVRGGWSILVRRVGEALRRRSAARRLSNLEQQRKALARQLRNRKGAHKRTQKLRKDLERMDRRIAKTRRELTKEAEKAASKLKAKTINTLVEGTLKIVSGITGSPVGDFVAKLNKLRQEVPERFDEVRKVWERTAPKVGKAAAKSTKVTTKLPFVSTVLYPLNAYEAKQSWDDDKYTGNLHKVEKVNDGLNMGGVAVQGAGLGTMAVGAGLSSTLIGAPIGVPIIAVGGVVTAAGEVAQTVSLGVDAGMVVWDHKGDIGHGAKEAIKWVSPFN